MKGRGVGLAAPQIGVKKRIFVMEDTEEGMSDESEEERERKKRYPFKAKVVINPVLIPIGDASAAFMEGCLSVQGYRALVRRHLKVKLKGVAPDVPMRDIYIGILPFWIAMMICLVILVAFPQISLILPNTMLN